MELTRRKNKRIPMGAIDKLIPLTLFLVALMGSIICLAVLLGCSKDDSEGPNTTEPQTGSLTGSVKDADGNTYPNVLVKLSGGSVNLESASDPDGSYRFEGVNAGTYDIALTLPLATKFSVSPPATVTVPGNQTTKIDFVVQPQEVKANLNFGNVQLLEEIKDKNGNTPTQPDELLYAANIFDDPIGLLTAIKAPDGHHLTLAEYQTAKGSMIVHCNGDSATLEIALEGMIPNGTYTFWLAYLNKTRKVGEPIDFANDFVNFTNPPVGSASGTENIVVAKADGTIATTLEHASCILTDEVALVIPILYHINGTTFGGGHVPDPEEVVQMLVYFQ